MDFGFSPAEEAFRQDVRRWLRDNIPADLRERGRTGFMPDHDGSQRWTALLAAKGWSVPSWPQEHGGPGWSHAQRYIFEEEVYLAGAPQQNVQGTQLVGPVIYTFGTAAQKQRFLPGIRNGTDYWTQGFSEPNAGSDLVSLRTTAIRQGDHYVVNGQKIWTSQAQYANWLFLLVRTDPAARPQQGISFLLVDMKTPGVTVRPIISIDGCHHLNETFYDDVRVPVENLIGEENKGWGYTKFLLGNERAYSGAEAPALKRYLQRLREVARRERAGDRPLIEDPAFACRLAELELEVQAIEMSILRILHAGEGTSTQGWAIGSVLKVRGTELQQRLGALLVEALGQYGAVLYDSPFEHEATNSPPPGPDYAPGGAAEFLMRRAATIYGGTNEVQRNIIAKMMLQL
jgi:alkylation response protein AidB-like acyl-CoA dehydrogenase